MTTTPPPHPPQQSYERPYYGPPMLGLPGNPEFYFVVIAWVVILIVTLAADSVGWPAFVTATIVLAGAYILSRGIAKAGKVFEQ